LKPSPRRCMAKRRIEAPPSKSAGGARLQSSAVVSGRLQLSAIVCKPLLTRTYDRKPLCRMGLSGTVLDVMSVVQAATERGPESRSPLRHKAARRRETLFRSRQQWSAVVSGRQQWSAVVSSGQQWSAVMCSRRRSSSAAENADGADDGPECLPELPKPSGTVLRLVRNGTFQGHPCAGWPFVDPATVLLLPSMFPFDDKERAANCPS
jgi:hypothetical protein